jgi:hypothetical protein
MPPVDTSMAISGMVLPHNPRQFLISKEDSLHLSYPLTTLFLKIARSFDNSVPENDPIL